MPRKKLYCRAIALLGISEFIESLGGDAKGLFAKAGLSPKLLGDKEGFIAWNNVCHLLELCAVQLNEPQFGVKWALSLPNDFRNTGPSLLIMQLVPDIRSYIDVSVTYQKIHTNGIIYTFNEHPETKVTVCAMDFHPASAPHRQYSEYMMMTMIRMARLNRNELSFNRVNFAHAAPKNTAWYESVFGCRVYFDQARAELHINPPFMDLKFDVELKVLQPLLKLYWDENIGKHRHNSTPMRDLTAATVSAILGVNRTDINTIAQMLAISPKKLQRLLKEEGITYTDIRDEVRREMAERLLIESDISIAHLSRFLDYTTPESFNAACKRWTGVSPQAYRKRQNQ